MNGRGCGVAGAGRSPIRNPGRNWAPGAGLGDVGEPRVIGSDPTGGDSGRRKTSGQLKKYIGKRHAIKKTWHGSKMLRFLIDRIINV